METNNLQLTNTKDTVHSLNAHALIHDNSSTLLYIDPAILQDSVAGPTPTAMTITSAGMVAFPPPFVSKLTDVSPMDVTLDSWSLTPFPLWN